MDRERIVAQAEAFKDWVITRKEDPSLTDDDVFEAAYAFGALFAAAWDSLPPQHRTAQNIFNAINGIQMARGMKLYADAVRAREFVDNLGAAEVVELTRGKALQTVASGVA